MGATIHVIPTAREPQQACAECAFFHPDTGLIGGCKPRSIWQWLRGVPPEPSARAMQYAVCTARGGNPASWVREYTCKGSMWKPKN